MPAAPWHGLTRGEHPSFPPLSPHESSEVAVVEEEEPEVEPHGSPRCRANWPGHFHLGLRQDRGPPRH